MYSVIAVANYFIQRSLEEGISVTNFRLQKMAYFAHAAYFCDTGKPMITLKEPVMAWQHGPVFPELYITIKDYKHHPIDRKILIIDFDDYGYAELKCPEVETTDKTVISYLDKVWDICSEMDVHKLRCIAIHNGGAWYKTVKEQNINPADYEVVKKKLQKQLYIPYEYIKECGR